MALSGIQTINIGLPNESAGSDSLYVAFNKINQNFSTVFSNASPFSTFNAGNGIGITANSVSGIVTITNTGVTQLTTAANSGIILSNNQGNIEIALSGGTGNGTGTVTSVGVLPVSNTRLTSTGSPVISAGNIFLDLATTGVVAGNYSYPTLTIDSYGRVTGATSNPAAGTVTSVSVVPGSGIQVTGSPVTTSGTITVTNTGVTRLAAGAGISLSGNTGNITISAATSSGTVTSVGLTSNSLVVANSPVVSSGTISVELPNNATFSGNVTANGIKTDNIYYANGTPWDMQQPSGANTQIQYNNANNFGASANLTFDAATNIFAVGGNIVAQNANLGNAVSANYFIGNFYGTANTATTAGTVTTNAQPNITSVGTLSSIDITGNTTTGNLLIPTGDIIYTPRYGSFYSNVTQTNPVANTAMAMTFNNTSSANGVSIVSNSQLTVSKTGTYNIQFSAQCTKTDAGTDYIEIWLAKNGNTLPWTNTRLKLDGSNVYTVAAWNFVETLNASEYVQIMWGSADTAAQIVAIDSANTTMGVDVPSVIVTVTPVGA